MRDETLRKLAESVVDLYMDYLESEGWDNREWDVLSNKIKDMGKYLGSIEEKTEG